MLSPFLSHFHNLKIEKKNKQLLLIKSLQHSAGSEVLCLLTLRNEDPEVP